MSQSFICSSCCKEHPGLPTDWAFKRPDEVHRLSYLDEYIRCRLNADLCTLDEARYFLRGVVRVPFLGSSGHFGWGIWAEVSRKAHDTYLEGFNADLLGHAVLHGTLANHIPGYSETLGLPVEIYLQDASSRPHFRFAVQVEHALAHEQRGGISINRHHDMLTDLGFFKEGDA